MNIKTNFKIILSALLIISLMLAITACSKPETEENTSIPEIIDENSDEEVSEVSDITDDRPEVNIGFLKGPTGIGAVFMLDKSDSERIDTLNKYNYTIAGSADEIIPKLLNGELDIAALPTNVASTLYNKSEGAIQILAINNLGSFKIVTSDETVFSLDDLKGKTIISAGQGATPEYALAYILEKNGIDPKTDLTIEFKSENAEVAAAILAGEVDTVLLPEPFATQVIFKVEGATKIAIDLSEIWKEISDISSFTVGAVVARKEFINNNPNIITDFLTEYEESINLTLSDVDTTAVLCERFDIMTADIARMSIPVANLTFIDYKNDMKTQVANFLEVLYNANPQSVGDKLPGDDFYYIPD